VRCPRATHLPGIDRLASPPPERLARLSARPRAIGFHNEYLSTLTEFHPLLAPHMRRVALAWAARESEEPAALAARFFMAGGPLTPAELLALLGADLCDTLTAAEAVQEAAGRWTCAFKLEILNDLYLFSDALDSHPDAVMGAGGTSCILARASYPQVRIGAALDVGCGCGILALSTASAAERVVATDINSRALALSRFNAAVNGITNVELAEGADFAPVGAVRFGLIVCQPPFCPSTEPDREIVYLHGGARGDETALRLLAAVPEHLTPGGRAIFLSDYPLDDMPLEQCVRAAIPAGDVLVTVQEKNGDARAFATNYARVLDGGAGLEEAAQHLHEHLKAQGIVGICQAVVMVAGGDGRTVRTVVVPGPRWETMHRSDLDRAMRVQRTPAEDVANMCLRLTPGCTALFAQDEPFAPKLPGRSTTILPKGDAWLGPLELTASGFQLLHAICHAPSVAAGVAELTEGMDVESQARAQVMAVGFIRDAIVRGVVREAAG